VLVGRLPAARFNILCEQYTNVKLRHYRAPAARWQFLSQQ
jgi:hypothetical protein